VHCLLFLSPIFSMKPFWATGVSDGGVDVLGQLAFLGNGQYAGGGMKLAPFADPCDGLFSVVVLQDAGLLRFVRYAFSIRSGKYVGAQGTPFHGPSPTLHALQPSLCVSNLC
jgi:diacylglycerol kinase family enzyme